MEKPIVAVVGRPNVGKSTFFNQIAGERISIVHDYPGVTRDRIYTDCEWLGKPFTLIDTGGIDLYSEEELLQDIRIQAEIAIEAADVIIMMVDGRDGITGADQEVANYLRRSKKPVVLVVNKLDNYESETAMYEFYNLGLEDPLPISSLHKRGMGDVLDQVFEKLDREITQDEEEEEVIRVALVGKPNAGKSSLVNRLIGEKRVIVSNIPGTTRDAIDTPFEYEGKKYRLIDTAGIRRKSKVNEKLERYSVIRALAAIRRCDVALVVIDSEQEVSEQDAKIAGLVHEEGKGCIVVMNKWDLIEKDTHSINQYNKRLYDILSFITYAPSVYISAKTGQRTIKLLEMINEVYANCCSRVSTGILNDCLADAMAATEPPTHKGRRLKIYYATQVSIKPPVFMLFVNDKELMHFSYLRYLENYFRRTFNLEGTSIKIILREKKRD